MEIQRNGRVVESEKEIYTIEGDPVRKRLPSFDASNRVTLSWHNLNVFVKPEKKAFWDFRKDDVSKIKQLLYEVNGEVRPGQLLAIMGASGAGKTTFLNVLTNRNVRKLNVEGEVLVNGQNIRDVAGVSAYVQQDDLFIGTLTVKEQLVFQAQLRMDKHLSYTERMKKVEQVIKELGLSKCKDTMIGIVGRVKGISGGERKRLAFAAEVLTNPALMFCDEPTSGLDSFMSQNIVSVLKQLSSGGRTIVCTIHQPSSEVYEMFDNLLLLAEGQVAYMGEAVKALEFFQRAGLTCPVNYNPADFFVHNLAITPGREAECKEKVKRICDQFAREKLQERKFSSTGSSYMENRIDKNRYKASWCSQLRVVMWRSWISSLRDPMATKVKFMQTIVISLLFGLIYLNQKLDDKGVMNINGVMFLALMNLTFQNMMTVINVFTLETPIFLREHWNGMYRTDIYFLSKTITQIPIMIATTTIFVSILYWMVGLNPDYKAFLIALGIFNLIAFVASSFGYMISCISGSLNVALSIAAPMVMPLVLFGGFYLNDASIPVYFVWIKYISWLYYANEALVVNQWSSVGNITCPDPICPDGKAVIQKLNFHEDYFVRDISLTAVLVVFYSLLAFIALLIRSSKRT